MRVHLLVNPSTVELIQSNSLRLGKVCATIEHWVHLCSLLWSVPRQETTLVVAGRERSRGSGLRERPWALGGAPLNKQIYTPQLRKELEDLPPQEKERAQADSPNEDRFYLVLWLRPAAAGWAGCPLLGPEWRGVDSERWVDGPRWLHMDRALPSKQGKGEKRSADTGEGQPLNPRANCSRVSRWTAGIRLPRRLLLVQAR